MKAFNVTLVITVIYYVSSSTIYDELCKNKNGDFLKYPLNCQKFIRCSHGKAYEFQCPANLIWHQEIKTCDYAFRIRCESGGKVTEKTINIKPTLKATLKKTRKKMITFVNKTSKENENHTNTILEKGVTTEDFKVTKKEMSKDFATNKIIEENLSANNNCLQKTKENTKQSFPVKLTNKEDTLLPTTESFSRSTNFKNKTTTVNSETTVTSLSKDLPTLTESFAVNNSPTLKFTKELYNLNYVTESFNEYTGSVIGITEEDHNQTNKSSILKEKSLPKEITAAGTLTFTKSLNNYMDSKAKTLKAEIYITNSTESYIKHKGKKTTLNYKTLKENTTISQTSTESYQSFKSYTELNDNSFTTIANEDVNLDKGISKESEMSTVKTTEKELYISITTESLIANSTQNYIQNISSTTSLNEQETSFNEVSLDVERFFEILNNTKQDEINLTDTAIEQQNYTNSEFTDNQTPKEIIETKAENFKSKTTTESFNEIVQFKNKSTAIKITEYDNDVFKITESFLVSKSTAITKDESSKNLIETALKDPSHTTESDYNLTNSTWKQENPSTTSENTTEYTTERFKESFKIIQNDFNSYKATDNSDLTEISRSTEFGDSLTNSTWKQNNPRVTSEGTTENFKSQTTTQSFKESFNITENYLNVYKTNDNSFVRQSNSTLKEKHSINQTEEISQTSTQHSTTQSLKEFTQFDISTKKSLYEVSNLMETYKKKQNFTGSPVGFALFTENYINISKTTSDYRIENVTNFQNSSRNSNEILNTDKDKEELEAFIDRPNISPTVTGNSLNTTLDIEKNFSYPTENSTKIYGNVKHNFITFKVLPETTVSKSETVTSSFDLTENFNSNVTTTVNGSSSESFTESPSTFNSNEAINLGNLTETFDSLSESLITPLKIENVNVNITDEELSLYMSIESSTDIPNRLISTQTNSKQNFSESFKVSTKSSATIPENSIFNLTESLYVTPIELKETFENRTESFVEILDKSLNLMQTNTTQNLQESSEKLIKILSNYFSSKMEETLANTTESSFQILDKSSHSMESSTKQNFQDSSENIIESFTNNLNFEALKNEGIIINTIESYADEFKNIFSTKEYIPESLTESTSIPIFVTRNIDVKTTESNDDDIENFPIFNNVTNLMLSLNVSNESLSEITETLNSQDILTENFIDKTTATAKDYLAAPESTVLDKALKDFKDSTTAKDYTTSTENISEVQSFTVIKETLNSPAEITENFIDTTTESVKDYTASTENFMEFHSSTVLDNEITYKTLKDSTTTLDDIQYSISSFSSLRNLTETINVNLTEEEISSTETSTLDLTATVIESLDQYSPPLKPSVNMTFIKKNYNTISSDKYDKKFSSTYNSTVFYAVNITENVNLSNILEEFETESLTTELIQNSSNFWDLIDDSTSVDSSVFNSTIYNVNLTELERHTNINDIYSSDFITDPAAIEDHDENENFSNTDISLLKHFTVVNENFTAEETETLNKELTTNKINDFIINQFSPESTTNSDTMDLTNEFNSPSTTIDPRLPFRSPQCQGGNNRRQFKALKCFQYYQCFQGWAFLLNCHEGWLFDVKEGRCVLDVNKKCDL